MRNVIPAGTVSVRLTFAASLGPAFDTVMVYVSTDPVEIGSGESVFVTETSAEPTPTVVVEVALSLPVFGSGVVEDAVAVLEMIVPPAVPALTLTTSVKTALPTPRVAIEQLTLPVPPTAGVLQDHPPGEESDTKVVPAGSVSARATDWALLGPAFVTVMV